MVSQIIKNSDILTGYAPVRATVKAALLNSKIKPAALYDIIKHDPSLSLLILRSVNSKIGGLYNSVSSLKYALNILGLEKVKFLNETVEGLGETQFISSEYISSHDFWKHSLAVALISEAIAKHIKRFSPINADNLFCAALFHDIGVEAISKFSHEILEEVIENSIKNSIPFYKAEKDYNHSEVGAEILRYWGIPEKIYGPIWYHHNPSSTEKYKMSASVIHVADVTAQLIGMPLYENEVVPQIDDKALKLIGLSPERLNVIARDAMDTVISLEKEFKLANL